ncbi:MAG: HNH endonuclease [Bacteroidota bacterium]
MKLYVGVTDNRWFTYNAERRPDEVNFWRPGGRSGFAALEQGAPFLFKLHSPENFIAGGGFFYEFSKLPISLAWRVFGEKNGCPDLPALRKAIIKYKENAPPPGTDPIIGCIVLAIPFFFPRELWIPPPLNFKPNTVQGKTYETSSGTGKRIWNEVLARLGTQPGYLELEPEIRKKGPLYVVEGRIGQSGFRTSLIEAYHRRCAISQERTMPALEASHIKPYNQSGPNKVSNGLLLRADLHQIFDEGYITITTDFRIEVSKRIKQEYENGREYYRFNGLLLPNLPDSPHERPDRSFIQWHNENLFRG